MKRWENCVIPNVQFQVEEDELPNVRLRGDASFYFNLKTFFYQVQQ